MQVKRSITVLLGAAGATMSASAGYKVYKSDDEGKKPVQIPEENANVHEMATGRRRLRPLRAISKKELGLEQSMGREVAHWISSATVYAATQAFYASSKSHLADNQAAASDSTAFKSSNVYHGLFGWLQELALTQDWDPKAVIHSSSFTMLLNVVSGTEKLQLQSEVEAEVYRAINQLATNAQCAKAIAERATRYGKQALLNMAQTHEADPRLGAALHRLVVLDGKDCRFGPANLVSLLSLAVADVPDEYMEFAYWALSKAASPTSLTTTHEWRKTLFGDDMVAKTRRHLNYNQKLWEALVHVQDMSDMVQMQAARLMQELSQDKSFAATMQRHGKVTDVVMRWMQSSNVPLACMAFEIASNMAMDGTGRQQLVASGAFEMMRRRILENKDCRMTACLLKAVHCIAQPIQDGVFALDSNSLSLMVSDDAHPLHHEDLVHPDAVVNQQYVDGWIELFTDFLKSDDQTVRNEAALCLEQIALHGIHKDQGVQEWLIAILDSVLATVPAVVARASTSVRDAKSRTRPIVGYEADSSEYEASHAKALRALAFVLNRRECQEELVKRGGIPLLRLLMNSTNYQVQCETARVLANVFTCEELNPQLQAFAVQDQDLVETLTVWSQSKDVKLQSLAHRAYSNLRYQRARANNPTYQGVKYLDGIHPLHFTSSSMETPENGADYDVDVVFVHGLLGCPYTTWACGDDDERVWAHEWLLDDLKQKGFSPRVLSVGYDSQLLASESVWQTMCFKGTSEEILTKLQTARVGAGDRPVVFVTHSLGGVLLKQVLLDSTADATTDNSTFLKSVQGVVFYGVPHHGSPVAQTIQTLRPRTLGIEQHPVTEHLHGTPHSSMLNEWCKQAFETHEIPALSLGESLPCRLPVVGIEALVVPSSFANPGFGDFMLLPDATHIDVCKPKSKDDPRYTLTVDFITQSIPKKNKVSVSLDDPLFIDHVDVD